jgi:monoamine oxidase
MTERRTVPMSRRHLLAMIGTAAGSSPMYQAMTTLGLAAGSTYKGPIRLEGDPKGASVLILGAGIAGLVAALELHKIGYQVQVLEYNDRAGGRCWSLRGGDRFTELGGFEQTCDFDKDLYFNPGPWRIPYHHRGILDYCKRLGVKLEPFIQVNYNAYLHARNAFGGKPQRLPTSFRTFTAASLSFSPRRGVRTSSISRSPRGTRNCCWRHCANGERWTPTTPTDRGAEQRRRGYERDPGGGLRGEAVPSEPLPFADILRSRVSYRATTNRLIARAGF